MDRIKELRLEIDSLDHELMELVQKRFELSRRVISEKQKNNLGTYDKKREEFILVRARNFGPKVEELYQELLRISKEK